jgi:hypothetical protein
MVPISTFRPSAAAIFDRRISSYKRTGASVLAGLTACVQVLINLVTVQYLED